MKNILLILTSLLFISCASIENHNQTHQPVGQQLIAGKGDAVLRISHERNLPNTFGGSDIFGRKTNTGETILTFAGTKDKKVYFHKSGMVINSNETTMSRTGMFIPTSDTTTMTGMVGTTPVMATATHQSNTYIPPSPSREIVTPKNATNIVVNLNEERFLATEGYIVEIISASANNLTYTIKKQ